MGGVATGMEDRVLVEAEKDVAEAVAGSKSIIWRLLVFLGFTVALGIAMRHSLVELARLSMRDETFSHMPLIPLVSGYLLFSERRRIFSEVHSAFLWGGLAIAIGLLIGFAGLPLEQAGAVKDQLSRTALAALVIWYGGYLGLFGPGSFRKASFPLLFLLFLVPIPSFLLYEIVRFLQWASTEVAYLLFQPRACRS